MLTLTLVAALALQPTSPTPPKPPQSPTPVAKAPEPNAALKVADSGGVAVRYLDLPCTTPDRSSPDRALVLIHGWSCDHTFWADQFRDFSNLGRVIAIDLPGHGVSDKPQIGYSMDDFAKAIAAVLDEAGVTRAVLVGHSLGTPVIRQFWRLYPDRTLALVAVDGSLRPWSGQADQLQAFIDTLNGPDYHQHASEMVAAMTSTMKDPKKADRVKAVMLATPQHVMVGAMQAALDPSIWTDEKISVPLLVVNAESPWWDEDYHTFVQNLGDDVKYVEIKDASHFVMMDQPEEFNRIVAGWLGGHHLLDVPQASE